MPAVQTNYDSRIGMAVHGQVATGFPHGIDTRSNTDAISIGFGDPVSEGDAQGSTGRKVFLTCKPFVGTGTATADDYVGVAIKNVVQQAETDEYKQYTNVDVLVFGDVWLKVVGAVTPGDNVQYRSVSAGTAPGKGWNTAAVSNTTGANANVNTTIPNARWMTQASDDGYAIARFGYGDSLV